AARGAVPGLRRRSPRLRPRRAGLGPGAASQGPSRRGPPRLRPAHTVAYPITPTWRLLMKPSAFLGLRTVIYYVPDMARARTWYRTLLGVEPYFDQPFYIGFNVGGFELGLHPVGERERAGAGGPASYWGVERMTVAWPRALGLGAVAVNAPQ